jgi:hypothetical protein
MYRFANSAREILFSTLVSSLPSHNSWLLMRKVSERSQSIKGVNKMLRAVLVLSAFLFSSQVFANDLGNIIDTIGGIVNGGRPGPGPSGYNCIATDRGWEEHFGGHRSCQECNARHGNCIEECRYSEFVCVAQGVRWGRPFQIEEYGYDQYDTERRALWACERRGGMGCRLMGPCHRSDRSERRECFSGGPGHGGGGHGPGHGGGHRPGRPGGPGRPGFPGRN